MTVAEFRPRPLRVEPPRWYRSPPPPRDRWLRIGTTAVSIAAPFGAAASLVSIRARLANTSVALVLALVVVLLAAVGTRASAILAALSASAGFDLFHTEPYGSFAIRQPTDVQATVLLLVVALVVGQLAVRNRGHRHLAATANEDLDLIFEAAEMVAEGLPAPRVLAVVGDSLTALLALRHCRFDSSFEDRPGPFVSRDGSVVWGAVHWPFKVWGLPDRDLTLTVEHAGRPLGRFVLTPSPRSRTTAERLRVAVALADQAGAAVAAA